MFPRGSALTRLVCAIALLAVVLGLSPISALVAVAKQAPSSVEDQESSRSLGGEEQDDTTARLELRGGAVPELRLDPATPHPAALSRPLGSRREPLSARGPPAADAFPSRRAPAHSRPDPRGPPLPG